jgi:hypothetical protein
MFLLNMSTMIFPSNTSRGGGVQPLGGENRPLSEGRLADAFMNQADGLIGQAENDFMLADNAAHANGVDVPGFVQAENVGDFQRRARFFLFAPEVFFTISISACGAMPAGFARPPEEN